MGAVGTEDWGLGLRLDNRILCIGVEYNKSVELVELLLTLAYAHRVQVYIVSIRMQNG